MGLWRPWGKEESLIWWFKEHRDRCIHRKPEGQRLKDVHPQELHIVPPLQTLFPEGVGHRKPGDPLSSSTAQRSTPNTLMAPGVEREQHSPFWAGLRREGLQDKASFRTKVQIGRMNSELGRKPPGLDPSFMTVWESGSKILRPILLIWKARRVVSALECNYEHRGRQGMFKYFINL